MRCAWILMIHVWKYGEVQPSKNIMDISVVLQHERDEMMNIISNLIRDFRCHRRAFLILLIQVVATTLILCYVLNVISDAMTMTKTTKKYDETWSIHKLTDSMESSRFLEVNGNSFGEKIQDKAAGTISLDEASILPAGFVSGKSRPLLVLEMMNNHEGGIVKLQSKNIILLVAALMFGIVAIMGSIAIMLNYMDEHIFEFTVHRLCGATKGDIIIRLCLPLFLSIVAGALPAVYFFGLKAATIISVVIMLLLGMVIVQFPIQVLEKRTIVSELRSQT